MYSFKKYLAEKLLSEEFGYDFHIENEEVFQLDEKTNPKLDVAPKANKSDADAKGKMLELLVGAHANGGIKNGQVVKHAEDTRGAGKKAKDIHDALVTSMFGKEGTNHPGYKRLVQGAQALHKEWERKNLKPGEKVVRSHWSSQPGDLEKITSKKDPDSKADVIHEIVDAKGNKRFAPVSLKIGASDPNLANNGSKTLAHHSGADESDLTDHWKAHTERMSEHYGADSSGAQRQAMGKMDEKVKKEGIESVRKYHKELSAEKNPTAQDKARIEAAKRLLDEHDKAKTPAAKQKVIASAIGRHDAAEESSKKARRDIAQQLAKSFNAGKPEDADARIRKALMSLGAPPTAHKESIAIAHEDSKGNIHPHVFDAQEMVHNHINDYHGLHAEASGISVYYYGTDKTGKRTLIASHGMKQTNGAHAGWNSTMKLPGIIKKTVEREEQAKAGEEADKAITKAKAPPKATTKPVEKAVAKPAAKPAVAVKPAAKPAAAVKPKSKVVSAILNKRKPAAQPDEYNYSNARSQALSRKANSGDDKAKKELDNRSKKQAQ